VPFTIRPPADGDYVALDRDNSTIKLPDNPWMALRITRVESP
jgi:hypothetical protein